MFKRGKCRNRLTSAREFIQLKDKNNSYFFVI